MVQLGEGKVAKILSAKTQVVAGTNYDLQLELTSGKKYQVVVYGKRSQMLGSACQQRLPSAESMANPSCIASAYACMELQMKALIVDHLMINMTFCRQQGKRPGIFECA